MFQGTGPKNDQQISKIPFAPLILAAFGGVATAAAGHMHEGRNGAKQSVEMRGCRVWCVPSPNVAKMLNRIRQSSQRKSIVFFLWQDLSSKVPLIHSSALTSLKVT